MPRRNRYHERLADVFPAFLRRWLPKRPAGGFVGTSAVLWDAMESARTPSELIPSPNALLRHLARHADTLTAGGFRVRARRTARARLVVVERIGTT